MTLYDIYQHPRTKEYIALKGDYMAGRFLPGLWQLSKGMYKKSALGFFGVILSLPGFLLFISTLKNKGSSFSFDETTVSTIVISLIGISILTTIANSSALDYKRHILKKGYVKTSSASVFADSEEEAVEKYTQGK